MQNSEERKNMFCPVMKEMCVSGRTKGMVVDKDGIQPQCRFWTHLYGKDPQSDKTIDQWDCAISWMPILGAEVSQKNNQTGASVDKMVNTFVKVLPPQLRAKLNQPIIKPQISNNGEEGDNKT